MNFNNWLKGFSECHLGFGNFGRLELGGRAMRGGQTQR